MLHCCYFSGRRGGRAGSARQTLPGADWGDECYRDGECSNSALPVPQGETYSLNRESVKTGSRLMVSSRVLYSVVMGVKKPGMGQSRARNKGQ